ncbi:MAG: methylenetetrahydrofolate reductase, partial [Desulfovibrio sp.]|nr:methylenetetrahydrofolate reductase [Desulfovibrio sp.]
MQIGEALANCKQPFVSFEFFPPQDSATLPEFYQVVRKLGTRNPLFVSVTYGAGGGKQQNTLAITAKLVEMGFLTMAHLTCVGAERTSIGNFLESLRFHGVTNVLALRGDAPQDGSWQPGMAEFKHAIDLVRFIKQEQPDFGIGVAAYPTPHPEANTYEEDRSYTAQKIAAGADVVITQLFFDVRDYFALVAELRAKGCSAPIIPGIL